MQWDSSQINVINASAKDRLLIDAGPGTGKTAVACARVSRLIDHEGLEPSRIWLISFTRVAVQEIGERIGSYLNDASNGLAIKIATLDSHAWALHSGFDAEASLLGTYEENIQSVLDLIRQEGAIGEYLERIEHLIVDEAQDIVGIRSELVIEFIQNLSQSCGITIFSDEAQAIYGFADDQEIKQGLDSSPTVVDRLRICGEYNFRQCALNQVHRTSDPNLLKIFSDTRNKVLANSSEPKGKLASIKEDISNLAHEKVDNRESSNFEKLKETFLLYRRRCEVLLRSSFLAEKKISHRVRMSGLPVCLAPWIGIALSEHIERNLTIDQFEELWTTRVQDSSFATLDIVDAWWKLVKYGGTSENSVDMWRLRDVLGRNRPPPDLCQPELGQDGPVVSTIHATKGREADVVHLMMPIGKVEDCDEEEESRVLFVGATRARSELRTGNGFGQFATKVDSTGRAYHLPSGKGGARAQVEFGREGDINAEGLAGRQYYSDANIVRANQVHFRNKVYESSPLIAKLDYETDYAYRLFGDDSQQCLAVLANQVNFDLVSIKNLVGEKLGGEFRLPPNINHLRLHSLRTLALRPDASECESLHEPWRSSGIMLAPVVIGYSMVYFQYKKKQWRRTKNA